MLYPKKSSVKIELRIFLKHTAMKVRLMVTFLQAFHCLTQFPNPFFLIFALFFFVLYTVVCVIC